jgi:hypothetical protein
VKIQQDIFDPKKKKKKKKNSTMSLLGLLGLAASVTLVNAIQSDWSYNVAPLFCSSPADSVIPRFGDSVRKSKTKKNRKKTKNININEIFFKLKFNNRFFFFSKTFCALTFIDEDPAGGCLVSYSTTNSRWQVNLIGLSFFFFFLNFFFFFFFFSNKLCLFKTRAQAPTTVNRLVGDTKVLEILYSLYLWVHSVAHRPPCWRTLSVLFSVH